MERFDEGIAGSRHISRLPVLPLPCSEEPKKLQKTPKKTAVQKETPKKSARMHLVKLEELVKNEKGVIRILKDASTRIVLAEALKVSAATYNPKTHKAPMTALNIISQLLDFIKSGVADEFGEVIYQTPIFKAIINLLKGNAIVLTIHLLKLEFVTAKGDSKHLIIESLIIIQKAVTVQISIS